MGVLAFLERLIAKVEDLLVVGALVVLSASVFLGVVFRYVLNAPLTWTDEVALLGFVWLVFIGAGTCTRTRSHMGIEMLVRRLSEQRALRLQTIGNVIVMVILGVLVYFGIQHALYAAHSRTTVLGIPWTYIFLSVPVGSGFMFIHLLYQLWGKD
ncbi:MAG: TRAP transporter small permease [Limnochordia bacterium]|jgi:TRAP-type C4-dicarboxylate transport system permease small subunit|nr:TRAP transporter small permease [Bacillota bacterium]